MLLRKPVVLPIFSPNSDLRVLTLSTVPGIRLVYFLRQPSCMGTKSLNILSTSPVKYTSHINVCLLMFIYFSSAEMFKKPLWQTVWTQIRLLLLDQSDLGPRCLLLYLIRQ